TGADRAASVVGALDTARTAAADETIAARLLAATCTVSPVAWDTTVSTVSTHRSLPSGRKAEGTQKQGRRPTGAHTHLLASRYPKGRQSRTSSMRTPPSISARKCKTLELSPIRAYSMPLLACYGAPCPC